MKKLFVFFLFVVSIGFAEDFQIKMTRPDTRGGKRYTEITASESTKVVMTADGQTVKDETHEYVLNLNGVETILEVGKNKQATKLSFKVTRCNKVENGKTLEVLKEGDEIIASRQDGKNQYMVNDKPAAEDVAALLGKALRIGSPDRASDDDILGTKNRVKVGDEWPVNAKLAASDFKSTGLTVLPENVSGTAKLTKIGSDQDGKYQEISVKIKLSHVEMPLGELKADQSEMTATFLGHFPLDPMKQKTFEQTEMNIVVAASGDITKDDKTVAAKMNVNTTVKNTTRHGEM